MTFATVALWTILMAQSTLELIAGVNGECCEADLDELSPFCRAYSKKSADDKAKIRSVFGENCQDVVEQGISLPEKRKPNFIRFGRSVDHRPNFIRFGRSAALQPNFVRFGRPNLPNFVRFGKRQDEEQEQEQLEELQEQEQGQNQDLLVRLVRKPNFIRFGRGAAPESAGADPLKGPNFIRFGRQYPTYKHAPKFVRFG